MSTFRYCLVRYISDRKRMEPINMGIVLQGHGKTDFKLSPHVAKRKEVDTVVYQQWREFFREEVRGATISLFQPDRQSPTFLRYLSKLCEDNVGAVSVNGPLLYHTESNQSFDTVMNQLYRELVLPADDTSPVEAAMPTGRFRQLVNERGFLKRGMKRKSPVPVGGRTMWPYRQVQNGHLVLIDKVEVRKQVEPTTNEIERLPSGPDIEFLLNRRTESGQKNEYFLLADKLATPFGEQSEGDFAMLRDEFERKIDVIQQRGGRVLRTANQVEGLANEIDAILPEMAQSPATE